MWGNLRSGTQIDTLVVSYIGHWGAFPLQLDLSAFVLFSFFKKQVQLPLT